MLINKQNQSADQDIVLVTGAGSGIGQAQALAFLRQGAQVIAVDRQAGFARLKNENNDDQLECFQVDLSQEAEVKDLFVTIQASYPRLDVLCNTAGQLDDYRPLAEIDYAFWRQIMANDLDSLFLVTQQALPLLLSNSKSHVINMASIAGMTTAGGGIAYTSAKHAIIGFTKQLAYEYSRSGLRVNAIAPGAIQTPMNQADFAGDGQMAEQVRQQIPLQRWAQVKEVADLTLFLASEQADYIQGAVIPLDGGWLIR